MQGKKPVVPPLGNDVEVVELEVSASRLPPYPKRLPEGLARECWDQVTRAMVAKNTYDVDCQDMVEAYCVVRARWLEAEAKAKEKGYLYVGKGKNKGVTHNPWLSVANHAYDRMVKLGLDLGLMPTTRGKVTKVKPMKTSTDAGKILAA